MSSAVQRRLSILVVLGALVLFAGCATMGPPRTPGQRLDPWENWNRKVYSFNEALDENVLKPVATVYGRVVPQPVRQGVSNFFGNAADAWSAVNNLLQGKFVYGLEHIMRVGTNTVFGIGGVFDVASDLGIERRSEDFGQTLGVWGIGPGAYIVWPLLGPSTVRETFALPLDRSVTPALVLNDGGAPYGITFLQIINERANLLGASRVLDDIALDKYTFVRDAYLQRRRSLVFDGDAPEPVEEKDPDGADAATSSPDAVPPPPVK